MSFETDDRFVQDWVDYGLHEMESFLARRARFDAFCARRDAGFRRLDDAVRRASAD